MNPSADNIEKLKANFGLAIGSNATTMGGVLLLWVILMKTGWVDGFWTPLGTSASFLLWFLADALNSYVLGRIRIEVRHGWQDIQIAPPVMAAVARWYPLIRLPSLVAVTAAVAIGVVPAATLDSDSRYRAGLTAIFLVALGLCWARHAWISVRGIAPMARSSAGMARYRRLLALAAVLAAWAWWFLATDAPLSLWARIGHGFAFFVLAALCNPLPSRFSIFRPERAIHPEPVRGVTPCEIWPGDLEPPAEIVANGAHLAEAGFVRLGIVRMPLIELPIFAAAAEVWRAASRDRLVLLMKSEVKTHWYRTVVSFHGDQRLIVTDFDSPKAIFPPQIAYRTAPNPTAVVTLLQTHTDALTALAWPPANADLDDAPWPKIETIHREVAAWLKRPGVEASASAASDAGSVAAGDRRPTEARLHQDAPSSPIDAAQTPPPPVSPDT